MLVNVFGFFCDHSVISEGLETTTGTLHRCKVPAYGVGLTGFEPATPCPPDKCATKLRYSPYRGTDAPYVKLGLYRSVVSLRCNGSVESDEDGDDTPRQVNDKRDDH